jgi:two-component system phosphate regulon sensor histidine kinase PhoR
MRSWRGLVSEWLRDPWAGSVVLLGGTALITLFIFAFDLVTVPLPNPGLLYLPLVAMLAYHWGWRHAVVGGVLELCCTYFFFLPPGVGIKSLAPRSIEQLVTLAAVTAFVLALVQLARSRRALAEREAGRFAALNRVGTALARELRETPLLHLIARTARELTGAEFAAFTLRPIDLHGQPQGPSEGHLFHLAAAVGVTPEQEAFFRRTPLGGEGLLTPIFRQGIPVRVADTLALLSSAPGAPAADPPDVRAGSADALETAQYAERGSANGQPSHATLRYLGVPSGHPGVRSFLGAPLLDREGQVRGGLLLGHTRPDRFTEEDEALLVGLAAQASVALENVRLYQSAHMQARELDATFESIADGITVLDAQGDVVRENSAAYRLREALERAGRAAATAAWLRAAAAQAGVSQPGPTDAAWPDEDRSLTVTDGQGEPRAYSVSAAPLRPLEVAPAEPTAESRHIPPTNGSRAEERPPAGAVVVWHDVTEARRLLAEQRAREEAEGRRALLQTVVDALPSGIYLVRGPEARLVLANQAAADVWGATWPVDQPMCDFLAASGTRVFGADGRPLALDDLATLRTVRTGEAVRHHQEVIRHADGTALPILLNAVVLDARALGWLPTASAADGASAPEAGEPERAALVVLQDVTALKEAEQLKDEFIGIAAHELRTPMATVRGFAQTLALQTARGKGSHLAAWQQEAIEAIDQATTRLVELTDDLLDVTRLQGGRLALRIEPTDLAALARRVATRLQITSPHHPITITAASTYIVALVDAARIEQVLGNLIVNAIKYSPDGGAIALALREDRAAGVAELRVSDHGIGIPTDQHNRIFGRFVRADNARQLGITGTGLGLYLCRELVERQDGRIWFESAEGQGSTFYITLPLAADAE